MKFVIIKNIVEGIIPFTTTRWLKKTWDDILENEPLIELNFDKVTIIINAEVSGKLTILKINNIKIGDTIAAISIPTVSINLDHINNDNIQNMAK